MNIDEIAELRAEQEEVFSALQVNADMTIYNKRIVGRDEYYQRAVISDIAWELPTKGMSNSLQENSVVITIPFSRPNYLDPVAWKAQPTGTWTLQVGDIVVKGEVPYLLSGSFTASDLKRAYNDVFTISVVNTVSQGIEFEHFQVGAK